MDLMRWFDGLPVGLDGNQLQPEKVDTLALILSKRYGEGTIVESVSRLRSKKNLVLHLIIKCNDSKHINLVAKLFISGKYDTELTLLKSSFQQGLTVPEVLAAQDGVILMTHISGEILVDRINHTFEPQLIDTLAKWYYKYHTIHKQIKGDPRLRNFICHGDGIYGVDFEESRVGHWTLDIGGVSASLLDTDPIFDQRKRTLSWRLFDSYLSLIGETRTAVLEKMFTTAIADSLKQTSIWRNDRNIFELSERIRNEGLLED
ncbi:MAG: hypothetical protein JW779_01090 [Candidatus Thorarchaeota archaeon]|nr:hypothetical protein [Candidatus Thorarchaeota archaeon]